MGSQLRLGREPTHPVRMGDGWDLHCAAALADFHWLLGYYLEGYPTGETASDLLLCLPIGNACRPHLESMVDRLQSYRDDAPRRDGIGEGGYRSQRTAESDAAAWKWRVWSAGHWLWRPKPKVTQPLLYGNALPVSPNRVTCFSPWGESEHEKPLLVRIRESSRGFLLFRQKEFAV